MELVRVIEYSDIFPEEGQKKPAIENLIQGINRKHLCTLVANMSNRLVGKPFLDNNFDPRREEFDCVHFFLSPQNQQFIQEVLNRYYDLEARCKQSGFNGQFISSGMSTVMAFQRLLFSLPPSKDSFNPHLEQNFFKAYLLMNEKVLNAKIYFTEKSNTPLDLRLAEYYLAYNYANEDVESKDYNDTFRRQLIKSICLFVYLFRDKRLKGLRRAFMAFYHMGNWSEYFVPHVMTIYLSEMKTGQLIVEGRSRIQRKSRRLIRQFSIQYDKIIPYDQNSDYSVFRAKPFIQLDRKSFMITNITFLIEHLFNNLYFDLKRFRKESGFCSDDEFRTYWTSEFSQKFMFHNFIRGCLHGDEIKVLDGCDCDRIVKDNHLTGVNPPDFYIRTPDCCILFEFKDTLFGAKIKDERDAEKLFKEIEKKFFKNSNGKPKGVVQLMLNAKAVQKGMFEFDDVHTDILIIPVLVVDNPTYVMRGMHTKMEYMMRDYCKQNDIESKTILPLILVDVATFRLHQEQFSKEGFYKVFTDYYTDITYKEGMNLDSTMETLRSFTEYMESKPISCAGRIFDQLMSQVKSYMKQ